MNINQRRQLINQLGDNIIDYINYENNLCGESFFDVSDLEERIAFLNTMYENYRNVDENMRVMVSRCIGIAMLCAERNLNHNKTQINVLSSTFDRFLKEKISTLNAHQQEIVYKNYAYIKSMLKNDLTLVGKTTEIPIIQKSVGDKLRSTTLPAIWHKITQSLNRCDNNAIRFRDCIIDILKSENQERRQECENMRNSFLNAQSNLVVQFADVERRITGRQNQPVTDNNLNAIMQQLHLGH